MKTNNIFILCVILVSSFYIGSAISDAQNITPRQFVDLPIPPEQPTIKKSLGILAKVLKTVNHFKLLLNPPPEPQSYMFSEKDVTCLAKNIYFEARGQPLKGLLAVGLVTMKRVSSKYYPDNVCDVVWQKNKDRRSGKYVAQFSWTLDGKNDIPKNKKAWEYAQLIASSFAGDGAHVEDFTHGAHLYHADYVTPYWSDDYRKVAQIGSHLFYK